MPLISNYYQCIEKHLFTRYKLILVRNLQFNWQKFWIKTRQKDWMGKYHRKCFMLYDQVKKNFHVRPYHYFVICVHILSVILLNQISVKLDLHVWSNNLLCDWLPSYHIWNNIISRYWNSFVALVKLTS